MLAVLVGCKYMPIIAPIFPKHYDDVIMTMLASQITSLTGVYSIVYSGVNQRKHQSSASLAFVREIHRDRWISRTNGQLRGKCFHLMTSSWTKVYIAYQYQNHRNTQVEPMATLLRDTHQHTQTHIVHHSAAMSQTVGYMEQMATYAVFPRNYMHVGRNN